MNLKNTLGVDRHFIATARSPLVDVVGAKLPEDLGERLALGLHHAEYHEQHAQRAEYREGTEHDCVPEPLGHRGERHGHQERQQPAERRRGGRRCSL